MSHSYVIITTFEGIYFPLKKLIVLQNFKLLTGSESKTNVQQGDGYISELLV